MAKTDLTAARLRELLHYNPDTGVFTWVEPAINKQFLRGSIAGSRMVNGYLSLCIAQKRYYCHRLAWLYMTGESPREHIDHINGNPADNRFCNLREATRCQNMQNLRAKRSTVGAFFHKTFGLWYSKIRVNKVDLFLGYFKTEMDAHNAYKQAKLTHHPFGRDVRM